METVLLVIHLIIALALVVVILLQRSEGGALGIGGSGSGAGGGMFSARGAANALTRTTAILAILFMSTSLGLALFARYGDERPTSILDSIPANQASETQKQNDSNSVPLSQ